jgi:hypothetical protein
MLVSLVRSASAVGDQYMCMDHACVRAWWLEHITGHSKPPAGLELEATCALIIIYPWPLSSSTDRELILLLLAL